MNTKTITIRVPSDMYDGMAGHPEAGSITQQLLWKLQKAEALTKLSMNELRGMFTKAEWMALADNLNGSMVTAEFRYSPQYLTAHIEDGDLYEGLGKKWDINIGDLCEKCKSLTAAQTDALYTRVEDFWEHSATTDLEKWAEY